MNINTKKSPQTIPPKNPVTQNKTTSNEIKHHLRQSKLSCDLVIIVIWGYHGYENASQAFVLLKIIF